MKSFFKKLLNIFIIAISIIINTDFKIQTQVSIQREKKFDY